MHVTTTQLETEHLYWWVKPPLYRHYRVPK